jgi:hypothetical protein
MEQRGDVFLDAALQLHAHHVRFSARARGVFTRTARSAHVCNCKNQPSSRGPRAMAGNCSDRVGKRFKTRVLSGSPTSGLNVAEVGPGIYMIRGSRGGRRASAYGVSDNRFDRAFSKASTGARGTSDCGCVLRIPSHRNGVNPTGRHGDGNLESESRVEHRWLRALVRHAERSPLLGDCRGMGTGRGERHDVPGYLGGSSALLLLGAGPQHVGPVQSVFGRSHF